MAGKGWEGLERRRTEGVEGKVWRRGGERIFFKTGNKASTMVLGGRKSAKLRVGQSKNASSSVMS